ncbi:MAG: polyphosphate:AMP phosphotransferase [Gemmatimonadota bacterium]|nr:MAG: polyphosphate:AMP phosphotransferase [Gemmatimonadota bacterium]
MFEAAEVGSALDKATYKQELPGLRSELLRVQRDIAASGLGPVVIVGGVEGVGKGEVMNTLLEWMDARGVEAHAFGDPTTEEQERPRYWRFWRVLPPRGKMAVLLGSWYTDPIVDRVFGRIDEVSYEREMRRIRDFERMLAFEGVPVIKFWLHVAKAEYEKRLRKARKDPEKQWRISKRTLKFAKRYDDFRPVSEEALRLTSTGVAPWHIVEAQDERYRDYTVATTLVRGLREALEEAGARRAGEEQQVVLPDPPTVNVIRQLDLTQQIPRKEYVRKRNRSQARLGRLVRELHASEHSMILVFEGPDAAGKGGTIRRLTAVMDARFYRVRSVSAPTDEEAAHPYLWRFWRDLPRRGHVTIYDRSWYGRVLVERIEGFAARDDWQRAYAEINEFEAQLGEAGTIVLKFWLAISPEEQLRRFEDRETTPYKQYKLTREDWRNRKKWDAYEAAACDMIERTSTDQAPWILVPAEDKRLARVEVLRAVSKRLSRELT